MHRAFKANNQIHVFLLVRRVLLAAEERKTRVYCFSMRIIHTKHSGVAFELVTVLYEM